ncbi:MAG: class I SAM-dependent methyltransferase [Reichenbachiella sp.]
MSYYHTKESVQEYIQLAKNISGDKLIEQYLPHLTPESRLLEIGSGPGTDWSILKKAHKTIGSDYSLEFINHLNINYPNGTFIELDAITLDTSLSFGGIYANKVMHHLKDDQLNKSIKRHYEILNKKGVICHSFWKGEGSEMFKGMFVNYHNESSLRKSYEKYFEILVLEEYKEIEENDSILLIARKK